MILYFSASGNSRFIAETAAEGLQDGCLCLNDRMKKQDFREIYSDTLFILVCPVFAWQIPRIDMPGSYVAFMENPDLEHAQEMNCRAKKQLETLLPFIRHDKKLNPFKVTQTGMPFK